VAGGEAWSVQVGAFADIRNAERLEERLRRDGFRPVAVKRVEAGGRSLYRVFVGPFVSREEADETAGDIQSREELETRVVRASQT
jgi:rare lipoprotein A